MSPDEAATPQFRVVYYAPNPFAGDQVTLGVVVRLPDGSLRVIEAPHTPSGSCIGGEQRRATFILGQKLLHKVQDFDELPDVFGPQMRLSTAVDIPSDDPVKFAVQLVFGPGPEEETSKDKRRRIENRSSYGRSYLRGKGVWQAVTPNYKAPGKRLAPSITHAVVSEEKNAVLLMEPLSALRGVLVQMDVLKVYERFNAYKNILGPNGPRMIAYLLHGLADHPRAQSIEMLEGLSEVAEVIDTTKGADERRFLHQIRTAAGITALDV